MLRTLEYNLQGVGKAAGGRDGSFDSINSGCAGVLFATACASKFSEIRLAGS